MPKEVAWGSRRERFRGFRADVKEHGLGLPGAKQAGFVGTVGGPTAAAIYWGREEEPTGGMARRPSPAELRRIDRKIAEQRRNKGRRT